MEWDLKVIMHLSVDEAYHVFDKYMYPISFQLHKKGAYMTVISNVTSYLEQKSSNELRLLKFVLFSYIFLLHNIVEWIDQHNT